MSEAKRLTLALRGRWFGRYGIARCPAHGDKNPSLSLSDGEGDRLLARCHAGCSFTDIIDAMKGLGLIEGTGSYTPPSREDWDPPSRGRTRRRAGEACACLLA